MPTIQTKTVATLDLDSQAELFLYLLGADWHQYQRQVTVGPEAITSAISAQRRAPERFERIEEEVARGTFSRADLEAAREAIRFEMAMAKHADEIEIPFLVKDRPKGSTGFRIPAPVPV